MAISGSWGASAGTTYFNKVVSLGVSTGAQTYPNGTISVNLSGTTRAWWGNSTSASIVLYLCDSAGNNKIELFKIKNFTQQSRFKTEPNTVTINNTSKLLTNTALYLIATGDTGQIGSYGKITMTINTTTNSYTVTTASNPSGGGTTSGGGSKTYNTKVQLTATANSGYTFSSWSKTAGTLSTTSATPTTFTVPASNSTVTANFTANKYTLTVSKGTGIASVTGGGSVAYTSSNAITATASSGYTFKNWTSNNGGTFANANAASTNFTMPIGNTTVTANATINTYTLTVSKGSNISTVSGGGSIVYGGKGGISASAATGYSFKNWTSNNGGSFANANSATTTFTMPAGNVTVTANAQINSYNLTTAVSPSGGGTVTAGAAMNYNTSKQLTATAASGYTFSSWSKTAGTLSSTTSNPTTFTIGAGAATVTANFTANKYTLTVSKGTGISSVTGGGSIAYKSATAITATASSGYTFKNWTSNNGGTFSNANAASTSFTMPVGNTTVTANATINTYTLTVAKGSNISAVTGGGSIVYGGKGGITATAATGYSFKNWTSNNGGSFTNANAATTTFTMPAGNVTVTANAQINTYTLTTAVSPSGGGTVTASASMTYNSAKQLSATAASGYTFSSWSKTAGTLSSTTSNPTTFTIGAGNATVTANFTANTYALTVNKGTGISAVTGAGNKAYKSVNAITATASTGYTFKNWTSNNGGTFANANAASTSFTMPVGATTITANATINTYTLTVAKGTGISAVTGGGNVNYNSSNAITATVSTGYTFSKWTSNNGGTFNNANAASTSFTMPAGAATVTASATINTYTLTTTVSPSGGGTVTSGGSLTYNSAKQLTATANSGYTFSSWSNNAGTLSSTSSNPTTFTIGAGNATVTANFTANTYALTVAKGTGISAVTGGGNVAYTSSNAITATAATGYTFKNWTSNNGGTFANANAASTSFMMPVGATTVTANATINTYTLTVAKGTGIDSVTGGGDVDYNSSNAITATVSTGYSFNKWTSNNGGTFADANAASTSFTMPAGAATVTASATINTYTLTTDVSPSGGGTVTAGESLTYNSTKELTATANTGYTFSSWSKSAGSLSTTSSSPTTFTMGAGNATVTANFTHNTYTIGSAVSPTGGGTVTLGADSGYYNDNVQIVATPNTGYSFNEWTVSGGSVSSTTATTTTFTLPASNSTVTANFTHNSYSVASSVSPSGGGTVTLGAYSGYYNDKIQVVATPSTGYQFSQWSATGGSFDSASSSTTTFTLPAANSTVTATFTKINYNITTNVDPSETGILTASPNPATYGDTVTLTATPASGYQFVDYTTSPSLTITNDTFTMPASNVSVTANFEPSGPATGSLNKSSFTAGETAVLTIAGASSYSYRYKLQFNDDMSTGWQTVPVGTTSVNIYIPAEWSIHTNKSVTVTGGELILESYNEGTYIGDDTITGLSYTVLDNIVPVLSVYRCDASGNPQTDGEYGKYSYTVPQSLTVNSISYGQDSVLNPSNTGDILPGDKKSLPIGSNHVVSLSVTYGTETFTITRDIPKLAVVKKIIFTS
jgi:hypothetical protein